MIGIYKITNPKGRIYIGQSINIKIRESQYKNLQCKDQPAIYASLIKYGFESHVLEIIEVCDISELNTRERYWQEFYNSVKKGLNCKYTGTKEKSGFLSEETKIKISKAQKGKLNHRYGKKGFKPFEGKTHSEETKYKISNSIKGLKRSDESKKNYSKSKIGKLNPMFGTVSPVASKVKCLESGKVFTSIKEASEYYKINYRTLVWYLNNPKNNKTSLIKIK